MTDSAITIPAGLCHAMATQALLDVQRQTEGGPCTPEEAADIVRLAGFAAAANEAHNAGVDLTYDVGTENGVTAAELESWLDYELTLVGEQLSHAENDLATIDEVLHRTRMMRDVLGPLRAQAVVA